MDREARMLQIDFFDGELKKIERILSDITSGTGVLLTIAGLLSFLPQLIVTDDVIDIYTQHFFFWTLWLILIPIISYWRASLRVTSVIKEITFPLDGSQDSQDAYHETKRLVLKKVWCMCLENHDIVMRWNSVTKNFIYVYMFSLISNLYVFVFYGPPKVITSLILLVASIFIGLALIRWTLSKSQRNLKL